jgi:hypothetical protein
MPGDAMPEDAMPTDAMAGEAMAAAAETSGGAAQWAGARWEPLLTGSAAEEALGVAEEIAAALGAEREAEARARQFSLSGGDAGSAIFLAYLDAARPGRGWAELALAHLERAIDGMQEAVSMPGLYGGFAGVGWAVEHLSGRLFDDDEDPGREIAEVLAEHLGQTPWRGHYELIVGISGLGVYAVERQPRPLGGECVQKVVARLSELARRQGEKVTWWTPREWMAPMEQERYAEGNYNLGVSHGVPGVIGFLGEALGTLAGEPAAEARTLLEGAVAWLLEQRLPEGAGSRFPDSVGPGVAPTPTRVSWCYGDLGISCTLLAAARRAGEGAWQSEALAVGRATAERPFDKSGVIDAGLCHGTAGAAHLFNRLYQASGEPRFAEVARDWLAHTLALRQPGSGVAGFSAWVPDEAGTLGWHPEPGLLTGAAGVGLALVAAASAVEPAWDRMLLARIPERAASSGPEPAPRDSDDRVSPE